MATTQDRSKETKCEWQIRDRHHVSRQVALEPDKQTRTKLKPIQGGDRGTGRTGRGTAYWDRGGTPRGTWATAKVTQPMCEGRFGPAPSLCGPKVIKGPRKATRREVQRTVAEKSGLREDTQTEVAGHSDWQKAVERLDATESRKL
jgi:hypothetical protein